MLTSTDVIYGPLLSDEEIISLLSSSIFLTENMKDRNDLHSRGVLDRYINIAMGEIAEQSVLAYLNNMGIYAISAVDKTSGAPDSGYDILIEDTFKCSVKSSLSAFKSDISDILSTFTLATKRAEVVDINIQVYFWLDLNGSPRFTLPSEQNMAIIGWAGAKDLYGADYESYLGEEREAANLVLANLRPMSELGLAVNAKLVMLDQACDLDNEYGYNEQIQSLDLEDDLGI